MPCLPPNEEPRGAPTLNKPSMLQVHNHGKLRYGGLSCSQQFRLSLATQEVRFHAGFPSPKCGFPQKKTHIGIADVE